jgi:hypothetical protein
MVERRLTWESLQKPLQVEGQDAVQKILQDKSSFPVKCVTPVATILLIDPIELMAVVLANQSPEILLAIDEATDGLFLSIGERMVVDSSKFDIVKKQKLKK